MHSTANPWPKPEGYCGQGILQECRTTHLLSWCSLLMIRLAQEDAKRRESTRGMARWSMTWRVLGVNGSPWRAVATNLVLWLTIIDCMYVLCIFSTYSKLKNTKKNIIQVDIKPEIPLIESYPWRRERKSVHHKGRQNCWHFCGATWSQTSKPLTGHKPKRLVSAFIRSVMGAFPCVSRHLSSCTVVVGIFLLDDFCFSCRVPSILLLVIGWNPLD